jgi:hypothetical protein
LRDIVSTSMRSRLAIAAPALMGVGRQGVVSDGAWRLQCLESAISVAAIP